MSPCTGDFAVHARVDLPLAYDFRRVAALLETRLLVDDGEGNPHTALLVTAVDAVRVNVDAGVITGLYAHVDTDEVPDRLVRETTTWTRGATLRRIVEAPPDVEALLAGHDPEVQDAEHALTSLLRELVHRPATPDDERVLRRTCAILRRALPPDVPYLADVLRCADEVLAGPWDPDAPA